MSSSQLPQSAAELGLRPTCQQLVSVMEGQSREAQAQTAARIQELLSALQTQQDAQGELLRQMIADQWDTLHSVLLVAGLGTLATLAVFTLLVVWLLSRLRREIRAEQPPAADVPGIVGHIVQHGAYYGALARTLMRADRDPPAGGGTP